MNGKGALRRGRKGDSVQLDEKERRDCTAEKV